MTQTPDLRCSFAAIAGLVVGLATTAAAQQTTTKPEAAQSTNGTPASAVPADYVIGERDVLTIVFWKEKDLSAEVMVRPDGKISLPMLNDIVAVGLTPEQLAEQVAKSATKFVRDPSATVMVKAVNSRRVYVIGEVANPGAFPISSDMNVLQALAEAGGLLEHANRGDIVVVREENGTERRFQFDYDDVVRGRDTKQNIKLLPGDTILVR
jgi:polysaccharide biosynthesis/export protein